jgi:nicotinate-nucleotide adenylyltransferase
MKRVAERIGIFGGTFDPPHNGHVAVATDVADALDLDRLLWIPARRSPLKAQAPDTPDGVRVEMVRSAAAADRRFVVDTRELERPPPSYTVDTLEALHAESGDEAELFLILGIDQYADFDRWRDPARVRELATVVVIDREGRGVPEADATAHTVRTVPVRRVDVSATDIRASAAAGASVSDRVPANVAQIIERERLYR